jgi:2-phospho-L-lactate guanylyltransferase
VRVPVDLVVPVKALRHAKSRLAPAVADLDDADRPRAHQALALALVRDTLAAVAAAAVRRTVVVTAEPAALAGIAPSGVTMITDLGGGLNAAVSRGVEHLRSRAPAGPAIVAALQGDLPALRPAELDDALDVARRVLTGSTPAAFVADHVGTGTTLLVGAPDRGLDPRFGPASAQAHRAAGAVPLAGRWPGLRTDVDTPADLAAARALGAGPTTRGWLGRWDRTPSARTACSAPAAPGPT